MNQQKSRPLRKPSKKNKSSTNLQKFLWIDMIRVLAIFLVVIDHNNGFSNALSLGNQATTLFLSSFTRIGVPLFVMVSGSLLLTRETSYTSFFTRRIQRVLIPWITWSVIYSVWFFYTRDTIDSTYGIVKLFYQTFFGQFWYLWMLFGLYLLTPVLWKFIKAATSKDVLYAIGLWFAFSSLLPFGYHMFNPYASVSQAYVFLHLGYYVLGYFLLIKRIPLSKKFISSIFLVGILGQTIGLWYLYSMIPPVGFLNTNNSIFIVCATVSLFIFLYFQFKDKTYNLNKLSNRLLNFLSGASFFIFLSHGFIMEMMRRTTIFILPEYSQITFFAVLFNTAVVIGSSLLLYVLLRRLPIINTLLAATSK